MATNVAGDRDLSARDVQSLADADAVAAFFATLGYDTSERLPQSTAAMGITATRDLARALRDRAGNYLLALTADSEALDFVAAAAHARATSYSTPPNARLHPAPEGGCGGVARIVRRLGWARR